MNSIFLVKILLSKYYCWSIEISFILYKVKHKFIINSPFKSENSASYKCIWIFYMHCVTVKNGSHIFSQYLPLFLWVIFFLWLKTLECWINIKIVARTLPQMVKFSSNLKNSNHVWVIVSICTHIKATNGLRLTIALVSVALKATEMENPPNGQSSRWYTYFYTLWNFIQTPCLTRWLRVPGMKNMGILGTRSSGVEIRG